MEAFFILLFALAITVYIGFCVYHSAEADTSAERTFYFVMATFGILMVMLMGFISGSTHVKGKWADHILCEDSVTEIGHTVITDCDAYYKAPEVE